MIVRKISIIILLKQTYRLRVRYTRIAGSMGVVRVTSAKESATCIFYND
jgi:hypothetical protein